MGRAEVGGRLAIALEEPNLPLATRVDPRSESRLDPNPNQDHDGCGLHAEVAKPGE